MANDAEAKRKIGEDAMSQWLDKNKMSYLYVAQEMNTFAASFTDNIKRPDFLVLLESVGLVAVDVKNHKVANKGYTLGMEEEVSRVLAFERIFRLPVWYAYYSVEGTGTVWHWISALRTIEAGTIKINTTTKEPYLHIALTEFEEIRTRNDMGKLYTHGLPGLGKVAKVDPGAKPKV